MAATAHKTEEEKKEFFDSEEVLEEKITTLSQLIKKSKHFVAFTGGKPPHSHPHPKPLKQY